MSTPSYSATSDDIPPFFRSRRRELIHLLDADVSRGITIKGFHERLEMYEVDALNCPQVLFRDGSDRFGSTGNCTVLIVQSLHIMIVDGQREMASFDNATPPLRLANEYSQYVIGGRRIGVPYFSRPRAYPSTMSAWGEKRRERRAMPL